MKINKKILFLIILLAGMLFVSVNTAFSEESGGEFKIRKEILKFIPYKELNTLLSQPTKLVYMPYQELKKLIDEKSKPAPPAPVDYVINDIKLMGTIKDDYVTFDGDYKFELKNKTWATIPILSTNTGIKEANFGQMPAKITSDRTFYNVISDQTGEQNLKLRFDARIHKVGNLNKINFNIPDVSIADINVNKDTDISDFQISNKYGHVEITWRTDSNIKKVAHKIKKEKAITRPPKVIVNTNALVSIDEGLLQGYSNYAVRVYHNSIDKLTFNIPENVEIIDVSSPQNIINKGSHRVENNILTVYFNSMVKNNVNINIAYEKTFKNKKTELSVPNIYPTGEEISKVSGYLAVQSAGNSEIKTLKAENISRIDLGDLPYHIKSLAEYPIISAFSFLKSYYTLGLEVTPHKDAPVQVAMADQVSADSRISNNGIMTSKIVYTVRNMSEQFFKFNMPENSEILSAAINGVSQQVEKQENESKKDTIYLVNIKKYQDTKPFKLTVMYRQKLKLNNLLSYFDLKLPRVINMPVLTISWAVYTPENFAYWNFTKLNSGNYNYLSYLTPQINRHNVYRGRAKTQVASNYYEIEADEMADAEKVSGILPPEFTMPPVKGLKRQYFSGYLTDSEYVSVSMLGITWLVYYLIIFVMLYVLWKRRKCLIKIIKKEKNEV